MLQSEKIFTENLQIAESDTSPILIAKKELILPQKKIVLLDDITAKEKQKLKMLGFMGGLTV